MAAIALHSDKVSSSANAPLLFAIYFEVKQIEVVFRRCSSK